jgi:hypothetical protein
VDEHRRPVDRPVHLKESGSIVIEGVAALALAFVLLAVAVQVSFVMVARTTAESAAAVSARRAAHPAADLADTDRALRDLVAATVPGAGDVATTVERSSSAAIARISFTWDPPGPRLVPLTISVEAMAPLVVPP